VAWNEKMEMVWCCMQLHASDGNFFSFGDSDNKKEKWENVGEHNVVSLLSYSHSATQVEMFCFDKWGFFEFPPSLSFHFFALISFERKKRKKWFLLSFRSFIPGCIHEDTPHSAFDALMNHEYLHIILTNVFRYDLHQSVNQMIRWSENVFVSFFL
jgi:hypothetical protein